MTAFHVPRAGWTPGDPWFRRHPGLALTVAGILFAAVLSLRLSSGTPVDAYSMLYALPVGVVAVGLTVLWAVTQDIPLTPTGWASRVMPLLLLGALLGHATDRARRAES